jgi:hypothetical protein
LGCLSLAQKFPFVGGQSEGHFRDINRARRPECIGYSTLSPRARN